MRLLLVIVALLLPLRVIAADSMALRMALSHNGAAELGGAQAMPSDCPMLANLQVGDADGIAASSDCQTCPFCAVLATPSEIPTLALADPPAGAPASPRSGFISATPKPDLRPPIA